MARRIVDAHVHLYRTAAEGEQGKVGYSIWEYGQKDDVHFSDHPGDVASAVRAMDDAGASVAVVANLLDVIRPGVAPGDDLKAFNTWLCDVAERDPRFYPLIALDPSHLSVDENVAHLEEMVADHGAKGIKLHPPLQRLDFSNRSMWPIFEACQRLGVVVVSHAGPSRDGSGIGEPASFRPVLDAFPDLRIYLAHMGGAAWRQLAAIARDYPQVRFDLCEIIEWLGAPNAPTAEEMVELIREVGPERVMMGSDFPWYDIDHTVEQVLRLPGLTAQEQDGILGENAIRFFELPL
jgi:predicted TIM-barrel fold metal-dependent hydrolase